jgi:hypothetical protein
LNRVGVAGVVGAGLRLLVRVLLMFVCESVGIRKGRKVNTFLYEIGHDRV